MIQTNEAKPVSNTKFSKSIIIALMIGLISLIAYISIQTIKIKKLTTNLDEVSNKLTVTNKIIETNKIPLHTKKQPIETEVKPTYEMIKLSVQNINNQSITGKAIMLSDSKDISRITPYVVNIKDIQGDLKLYGTLDLEYSNFGVNDENHYIYQYISRDGELWLTNAQNNSIDIYEIYETTTKGPQVVLKPIHKNSIKLPSKNIGVIYGLNCNDENCKINTARHTEAGCHMNLSIKTKTISEIKCSDMGGDFVP